MSASSEEQNHAFTSVPHLDMPRSLCNNDSSITIIIIIILIIITTADFFMLVLILWYAHAAFCRSEGVASRTCNPSFGCTLASGVWTELHHCEIHCQVHLEQTQTLGHRPTQTYTHIYKATAGMLQHHFICCLATAQQVGSPSKDGFSCTLCRSYHC